MQYLLGSYLVLVETFLNFDNLQMRSGYGRSIFEPLLPLILGRDISGEVAAVGASVRSLTVGQEVFGALHPTAVRGTYADYAVLSEDELTLKPVSITHVVGNLSLSVYLVFWFIYFISYETLMSKISLII